VESGTDYNTDVASRTGHRKLQ